MSLQNRVDPWGQIHATPERGTMLGNRGGRFHGHNQALGKRRWASHHWIACELHYKNMHHEPMGQGYTSLFFLDEVTALAAGHRPCFFCRRQDAKSFLGTSKVDVFDRQLHQERLQSPLPWERSAAPRTGEGTGRNNEISDPLILPSHGDGPLLLPPGEGGLPDGAMIEIDGAAFAVRGDGLLRWSFGGYIEYLPRRDYPRGKVLTPPSITAILHNGYKPRWHRSALQWGST